MGCLARLFSLENAPTKRESFLEPTNKHLRVHGKHRGSRCTPLGCRGSPSTSQGPCLRLYCPRVCGLLRPRVNKISEFPPPLVVKLPTLHFSHFFRFYFSRQQPRSKRRPREPLVQSTHARYCQIKGSSSFAAFRACRKGVGAPLVASWIERRRDLAESRPDNVCGRAAPTAAAKRR